MRAVFAACAEGSLKEQLERLPVICRFQYTSVAEFVLNIIDPVLANYQSAVGQTYPQTNGAVCMCMCTCVCWRRGRRLMCICMCMCM